MTDATPQFLDPAFGSTLPRPPGLRAGDFPRQTAAATLRFWSIGASSRGLRLPIADTVGIHATSTTTLMPPQWSPSTAGEIRSTPMTGV